MFLDQVIKTSGNCSENIISYQGDIDDKKEKDEQDLLVPIIGGACGFGLIVLIIVIFVYYCKVVKKNKETEVKHENPVYNAWDYDYADDNYVQDVNNYYDK